jgi:hypothetical protein
MRVTRLPKSAMPSAPPSSDAISLSAEAAPDCSWGAALTMRSAIIVVHGAIPIEKTTFPTMIRIRLCMCTAKAIAPRPTPPTVVRRLFPDCAELYAHRGWTLFPSIDRVYVNHEAMRGLGWSPKYDFRHILNSLRAGLDFGSSLTRDVGSKGYHAVVFEDGPYPVAP